MMLLFADGRRPARRSATTWWWLMAVAGLVLATGCGSGVPGGASPVGPPDPSAPADEPAPPAGPTEESAARFAVEVVARLGQDALYAPDDSLLEPFVSPDARDVVAGTLDAQVGEVRWALATFPGQTRRVWFAAAPLTVAVTAFDGVAGTASVAVWVVAVFSREDLGPPETRFSIEQADLVWDDTTSRWRLTVLAGGPGPAAALASDQVPVTPAELDSALHGHRLIPATDTVRR